jgi:hypothetical protein
MVLALAAISLIACTRESSDTDGHGLNISVEEVAHWGCTDCGGPEQLSLLRGLVVDEDGTVFVLNYYEPFIRVWTRDGEHVLSFGTIGEGPGEMVRPWFLSVHEGLISVVDMGLRRWTLYDYEGTVVATRRMEGKVPFSSIAFAGGWLFHAEPGFRCDAPRVWRVPVSKSEVASVIASVDNAPLSGLDNCHHVYVGSMDASPRGGFAIGYGEEEYMILLFDTDGNLTGRVVREVEREPKTAVDRENDRELDARFAARGMKPLEHAPVRFHFYFDSLNFDSEGRLWVRTARGGENDVVFDVLDREGNLLASLSLPVTKVSRKDVAFDVAGDYLVTRANDKEDNPYVFLWRITWK